jgi:hypothetical protein
VITERYLQSGGEHHFRQLSGIEEIIDNAERIDNLDSRERGLCASVTGDRYFTHTDSLREAINLCKYGWPEGRERVLKAMSDLSIEDSLSNLGQVIEYDFDTSGDEPDVGLFLSGEPENMIKYSVDESVMGRNVKLLVNVSQHAFVDPSIITRRGIAIVAATETASAAGFGVQLEAVEHTVSSRYNEDMSVEYRIPLAEAGSYLNIDTLTFAIVHPSFLRRLVFALNENEPSDIRDKMGFWEGRGYGAPERIVLRDYEHAIIIDKDDGHLTNDDEIIPYATEIARKLIQ